MEIHFKREYFTSTAQCICLIATLFWLIYQSDQLRKNISSSGKTGTETRPFAFLKTSKAASYILSKLIVS